MNKKQNETRYGSLWDARLYLLRCRLGTAIRTTDWHWLKMNSQITSVHGFWCRTQTISLREVGDLQRWMNSAAVTQPLSMPFLKQSVTSRWSCWAVTFKDYYNAQWTRVQSSHLLTTGQPVQPALMATSLQQPPLYNSHFLLSLRWPL